MSPLGFKARVGSALFAIFAEANVMYIPKIHLWCYTCRPLSGRRAAGHFHTCMCRGGTWLGFERAIARTEDEREKLKCRHIEILDTRLFFSQSVFSPDAFYDTKWRVL